MKIDKQFARTAFYSVLIWLCIVVIFAVLAATIHPVQERVMSADRILGYQSKGFVSSMATYFSGYFHFTVVIPFNAGIELFINPVVGFGNLPFVIVPLLFSPFVLIPIIFLALKAKRGYLLKQIDRGSHASSTEAAV